MALELNRGLIFEIYSKAEFLMLYLSIKAALSGVIGAGFWPALAASSAITFLLYLCTIWVLGKFGVTL
jgi:hypothetical protein